MFSSIKSSLASIVRERWKESLIQAIDSQATICHEVQCNALAFLKLLFLECENREQVDTLAQSINIELIRLIVRPMNLHSRLDLANPLHFSIIQRYNAICAGKLICDFM
jgi:hypothetical protein